MNEARKQVFLLLILRRDQSIFLLFVRTRFLIVLLLLLCLFLGMRNSRFTT